MPEVAQSESVAALTTAVKNLRGEREAWEDAMRALDASVAAAHAGKTRRVALNELQGAREKCAVKLSKARVAEELAVVALLKAEG